MKRVKKIVLTVFGFGLLISGVRSECGLSKKIAPWLPSLSTFKQPKVWGSIATGMAVGYTGYQLYKIKQLQAQKEYLCSQRFQRPEMSEMTDFFVRYVGKMAEKSEYDIVQPDLKAYVKSQTDPIKVNCESGIRACEIEEEIKAAWSNFLSGGSLATTLFEATFFGQKVYDMMIKKG